jgi:hypothetical protein
MIRPSLRFVSRSGSPSGQADRVRPPFAERCPPDRVGDRFPSALRKTRRSHAAVRPTLLIAEASRRDATTQRTVDHYHLVAAQLPCGKLRATKPIEIGLAVRHARSCDRARKLTLRKANAQPRSREADFVAEASRRDATTQRTVEHGHPRMESNALPPGHRTAPLRKAARDQADRVRPSWRRGTPNRVTEHGSSPCGKRTRSHAAVRPTLLQKHPGGMRRRNGR